MPPHLPPTLIFRKKRKGKRFIFECQHQELLKLCTACSESFQQTSNTKTCLFPLFELFFQFFFFLSCTVLISVFFTDSKNSQFCSLSLLSLFLSLSFSLDSLAHVIYRQASSFISLFFLTSSACLSCQTNTDTATSESLVFVNVLALMRQMPAEQGNGSATPGKDLNRGEREELKTLSHLI